MYDRPEIAHLDRQLTSHDATAFMQLRWGPMKYHHPNFGVVRFEPRDPGRPALYVSTAVARGKRRRSFVALDEPGHARPLRLLTALAWWYRQVSMVLPSAGVVMPLVQPWSHGKHQTHVVVARPTLFGPDWRRLSLTELRWDLAWGAAVDPQQAWIAREVGIGALDERVRGCGITIRAQKPAA